MMDLHLHLDGSLTATEILELSRTTGTPLPTEDPKELSALMTFDGRGTLNDYLQKFDLPLSVLQSRHAVGYAVYSLSNRLRTLGYEYAEIRFAPSLHTRGGQSQDCIVRGALEGLADSKFPARLILCCMRGASEKENLETVYLAAKYRKDGIGGVDLAGAEALHPTENYREVFHRASLFGLNITIHAGEAAGEDSVKAALDFGARRIGHGVAAAGSESLLRRIKENDVLIECCPTSNLQTGAVPSLEAHPMKRFLREGIPVALCTDNMTVSDTDLGREWDKVRVALSLTDEDRARMTQDALAHRFR